MSIEKKKKDIREKVKLVSDDITGELKLKIENEYVLWDKKTVSDEERSQVLLIWRVLKPLVDSLNEIKADLVLIKEKTDKIKDV